MKRVLLSTFALALAVASPAAAQEGKAAGKSPAWSMNATIIEACSCPMFCTCYFDTKPAAQVEPGHEGHSHGATHFCRFNNAFKVNKGAYGGVKLDGAKFWVYGDLGDEFSDGEMEWAVVTFDKASTPQQREGIGAILAHLYPVKWKSMSTAEGDIEWVAGKDQAHAKLDGGKTAEVALSAASLNRNSKAGPTVISNLKYWGAAKNEGFVLMPNTVQAVRTGDKQFEFKNTNGFMITVELDSKAAAGTTGGGGY